MTFDPSDPHARRSVVGRAALRGAITSAVAYGGAALAGHAHPDHVGAAIGALGALSGGISAARHNRQTDAYEAQHGHGPAKRSVFGRTLLHGMAGDIAGGAIGAGFGHLAGHDFGSAGMTRAVGVGSAVGRVAGWVHGYRSTKAHNAMVDALVQARSHKQTMGGAVRNAQFEAKHRRIHGRFT